jgi:tRNA modification GTPase
MGYNFETVIFLGHARSRKIDKLGGFARGSAGNSIVGANMNEMEPICAPSTPMLPSSIAIVRISGENLAQALSPLLTLPKPRIAALRRLAWSGYAERALVIFFPAPHSYTGQDVVEFHLHGNPLLTRRFLEQLGNMGIRLAQPGEFTQRALLNGKQSLLEVEALHDLMDAATDTQIRQAQARAGGLPEWMKEAKEKITQLAAQAEASVDYGEEEGIHLHIGSLKSAAAPLLETFHVEHRRSNSARWLRDGIKVAIVGRPNAGKSTLFNAIAGEERAIVTDLPGTTRDILEVRCQWAGLPIWLFDTAGLWDSQHPIEQLGIAKVGPALEQADLILHLVPAYDQGPNPEIIQRLAPYHAKVLEVRSQSDLAECGGVRISAIVNDLKSLEQALVQRFLGEFSPDACLGSVATERQRDLLGELIVQMSLIADLPETCLAEVPASLLQGAMTLLCRLTGEDRADLSLDAMFSGFCLGK